MTVNKTTLDNGIRVLSRRMPNVRSVSMGVWVNVGARDESPEENGLSHFIEHMIFKGTTRRTAFRIAKEFDAIGGLTNAFTGMENTCYHARVIDSHMDTMVDILSDIFLNSVFDPREVESERPVILQEIGSVEGNPEEYIHVLSENTYWGDHPLGRTILGPRENIEQFDPAFLREFFHRFYQPERIVISIAGNVDHDRFMNLVGSAFESIRPGNGFPERTTPRGRSMVAHHYRDLEQTHICLETRGIPITDPRRFAFSLMNTITGGNMSSRLFQDIRERRGLAYSVYSFASSYVDTGAFGIYGGVHPDRTGETVDLITDQIRRLKQEPVSAAELKNAKEYMKGNLLLASESTDNQMVRLAQNEIHFGRYYPLQYALDHYEAVTEDHILELANDLFQTDQLTLTLLGPVPDGTVLEERLSL